MTRFLGEERKGKSDNTVHLQREGSSLRTESLSRVFQLFVLLIEWRRISRPFGYDFTPCQRPPISAIIIPLEPSYADNQASRLKLMV